MARLVVHQSLMGDFGSASHPNDGAKGSSMLHDDVIK